MSKVNEQLSKLETLFALNLHSLNMLDAHFVEALVDFGMQSSNNLLSSSALFAKLFLTGAILKPNRFALEKSWEMPVFVLIAAYINSKVI